MPYRPTGRANGRPKADRAGPLVVIDLGGEDAKAEAAAPRWWLVMADMEARLRAGEIIDGIAFGKRGWLTNLARHFPEKRGGGKSAAAVTKARNDPRYKARVIASEEALRQNHIWKKANPRDAAAYAADLRADIASAFDGAKPGKG